MIGSLPVVGVGERDVQKATFDILKFSLIVRFRTGHKEKKKVMNMIFRFPLSWPPPPRRDSNISKTVPFTAIQ